MGHWKFTLSYDGTGFYGWQIQPGLPTVQGTLREALRNLTGENILPQGSGRTDAGVHALAQVVSFSMDASVPPGNLRRALNRILPGSVRVLDAEPVPEGFHARHSAVAKTYEYRLFERRQVGLAEERICPPFLAPFVWDCRWPLDHARMQAAADALVGTHDFLSFAASDPDTRDRNGVGSEKSTVRTIHTCDWTPDRNGCVFQVRGSGFLHHMVRNLVGTLVDVGRGSLQPQDIPGILAARDRAAAGPTAPARGLYLQSVEYAPAPATAERSSRE